MEKCQVEATFEVWTFPRDFSPHQETSRETWVSMWDICFLSLHFILWGERVKLEPQQNGEFKAVVYLFLTWSSKPYTLGARFPPS